MKPNELPWEYNFAGGSTIKSARDLKHPDYNYVIERNYDRKGKEKGFIYRLYFQDKLIVSEYEVNLEKAAQYAVWCRIDHQHGIKHIPGPD